MQTLRDVVDKVDERALLMDPDDRFHPLTNFEFVPRSNGDPITLMPLEGIENVPVYEMGDHPFGQMASRLKFPIQYVRNLPPGIQHNLVNWHMHVQKDTYKKALMFRSVNGEVQDRRVRALMTDQYQPFDDNTLFRAVYQGFNDMNISGMDMDIKQAVFDETNTHVRLVWGNEERIGERGEVVRRGLHISNSEVGLRSVTIRAIVWVLACSNGMLSQKDMGGIRHVGDERRLKTKVTDAIGMAVNDGDRLSAQFADALKVRFENPVNVLEGIHKTGDLTQDQFQRSIAHFAEGDGRTKFDVVQAITRTAQDEPTAEARYQVELAGAKALDSNLERFDKEVA